MKPLLWISSKIELWACHDGLLCEILTKFDTKRSSKLFLVRLEISFQPRPLLIAYLYESH